MDPVTAALNLATEVVKLISQVIADQPKEVKEKAWRDWFEFWGGISKLIVPK